MLTSILLKSSGSIKHTHHQIPEKKQLEEKPLNKKIPHLPRIGSTIIEHEENDDAGISRFNVYVMINAITDQGVDVYILRSTLGHYVAATHADFESTHLPYSDGFYEETIRPRMHVVTPADKPIQRTESEGNDIVVTFDVFENRYQIAMPSKSSDNVYSDVVSELNSFVNESNFQDLIGKARSYKIKWRKDRYVWIRL
jgi:hypothetical protein